ncbi:MAG: PrgI family protein [bacterium]|nr:PrgI family protein [bacterium]
MQQFVVPQFIDVEDKIIGPVTTRQFVIMLAGCLVTAIFYKIFDFSFFVFSGLLTLVISGIFSFLKINGRPFHFFVLNLIQTLKRPRLRVWFLGLAASAADYGAEKSNFTPPARPTPEKHYTASRLAELSLVVDTKGAYRGEDKDLGITNVIKI